jgi:hypothetical protein
VSAGLPLLRETGCSLTPDLGADRSGHDCFCAAAIWNDKNRNITQRVPTEDVARPVKLMVEYLCEELTVDLLALREAN